MSLPNLSVTPGYVIDENPYEALYVDLTDRCNMTCNLCYNSSREQNVDMDIHYFEEVCRRLPNPVHLKFVGGEPALHPQFFDFIRIGKQYQHHVQFSSNGLVYTDDGFMEGLQELKMQKISFAASITLDGGYSSRENYQAINGNDYLDQKLQALENLRRYQIKRFSLTAIVARGINEETIPELLELAEKYKDIVRYIHFRTAASIGRFVDTVPYSLEELKELVRPYFNDEKFKPKCLNEIHCLPEENKGCCYRFRPTNRLQISLIEFASPRSATCHKRGKLLDDFKIVPFFEDMISKES